MILTSFQDFPCAKRGYTGAFGLMKVTLFEWAMSFGCIITQKCRVMLKHILVIHRGMQRKLRMVKKKLAAILVTPKYKTQWY
jgi:hypothetical protein